MREKLRESTEMITVLDISLLTAENKTLRTLVDVWKTRLITQFLEEFRLEHAKI